MTRGAAPLGLRLALWALALIGVFALSAGVSLFAFLRSLGGREAVAGSALLPEPRPEERINVLLLGVDAVESTERSDTIMVASLDPLTREAAVLSIPRDTLVNLPGRPGREKIAHAHAYGGPLASLRVVSELLDVPIHYYVKVDFRGFVALVDALGGVTLNVEKPMRYSDPYQNLEIDLQPGLQRLDGDKALQFVRYRQDGDLNRIRRQQAFLRALADEVFRAGTVLRLPRVVLELSRYVETNMSPEEIMRLARLAAAVDREKVAMDSLPVRPLWTGPPGSEHYIGEEVDPAGVATVVDRLLRGIDRAANGRIRVRVVDASGRPDQVQPVVRLLRDYGYSVLAEQARASAEDETRVIHGGQGESVLRAQVLARTVSAALGPVKVYRSRAGGFPFGLRAEARDLEGADLVLIVGKTSG